jgi:3-oxoacyl-[acyl-carrier-protein] synthase III
MDERPAYVPAQFKLAEHTSTGSTERRVWTPDASTESPAVRAVRRALESEHKSDEDK